MPYIPKEQEFLFLKEINEILAMKPTGGQLNYVISKLARGRTEQLGKNYENAKSVYGDLVLAAKEYYERVIRPYEDEKSADTGNADPYDGV